MNLIKDARPGVQVAAGVITLVGAAALTYFGGKAAVLTVAAVGGGLFALAVTNVVAQNAIEGGITVVDAAKRKIDEMQAERAAAAQVRPAAAAAGA